MLGISLEAFEGHFTQRRQSAEESFRGKACAKREGGEAAAKVARKAPLSAAIQGGLN